MVEERLIEIHPSDVNSALLCELRLDETLKENKPNPDLMRGSLLHAHVEGFLKREPFDPLVFLVDRFEEEYEITDTEEAGISDLSLAKLMIQAEVAFTEWKTAVWPHLDLTGEVSIEEERRLHIGRYRHNLVEYSVELVGSPDLVDSTPVIHDWKTAARMWDPTRVVNQAQPPLYGVLVDRERPRKFMFWVFSYETETWKYLEVTPTVFQIHEMLATAFNVAIKRELGLLTPMPGVPGFGKTRGWWCSPKYCRNWNACPGRLITNDGNDLVTADWKDAWS